MKSAPVIDLTRAQRGILSAVFSSYTDVVERVGVYGSRVQGSAQPGSDVDLVVFGTLQSRDLASIRQDLEESDLSIFADVVAHDAIDHPGLRAQVDHWVQTLFTRDDLLAAQKLPHAA